MYREMVDIGLDQSTANTTTNMTDVGRWSNGGP